MGNAQSMAHMARKAGGPTTKTRRKQASGKGKKSSSRGKKSSSSSSSSSPRPESSKTHTGSTASASDVHSVATDAYSQSAAETSSSNATDDTTDSANRLHKRYRQNEPIPDDARSEIKLIRQFLYDKDARNFDGMEAVTDDSCTFYFIDADTDMLPRHFYESVSGTFDSFPNLHFFWRYMKISGVDPETGCTIVKVKDYYGEGRHTGTPYTFEPFPDIPATGINVRDANIELQFLVKNDKVAKMIIDADGQLVGPPGFYTKIGGVIPGL